MSKFSSILGDLRICQDRQQVTKVISTLHTLLDEYCIEETCSLRINAAIDLLLDADRILVSMNVSLDPQVLMLVWKRLIAFFKSFHGFISTETASLLILGLNSRALHFVNLLCLEEKTKESELLNQNARDKKNAYLLSHLHFLAFYCQRISASMAYFSSDITGGIFQVSMEILLCLRGFLSALGKTYPRIDLIDLRIKSEEYFRKAIRSPPESVTVHKEMNKIQEQTDYGTSTQRITSEMTSYRDDGISIETIIYEKLYMSIKCRTYSIFSTSNEVEITNSVFLGYVLSIGLSNVICYEIEKIGILQLMMMPSPSNTKPTISKSCGSINSHLEPIRLILLIFLISVEKICVVYNCIGSDESLIDTIKRFVTAYVGFFGSISTETKFKFHSATASNILMGYILSYCCNDDTFGGRNMKSMIAHYLLSGIMSYMSPRSHYIIAESLWEIFMSVTNRNQECLMKGREMNKLLNRTDGHGCGDRSTAQRCPVLILSTMRKFLLFAHPVAVVYIIMNVNEHFTVYFSCSSSTNNGSNNHRVTDIKPILKIEYLEALLRVLPLDILLKRFTSSSNLDNANTHANKRRDNNDNNNHNNNYNNDDNSQIYLIIKNFIQKSCCIQTVSEMKMKTGRGEKNQDTLYPLVPSMILSLTVLSTMESNTYHGNNTNNYDKNGKNKSDNSGKNKDEEVDGRNVLSISNKSIIVPESSKILFLQYITVLTKQLVGFNKKAYIRDACRRIVAYQKIRVVVNTLCTIVTALRTLLELSATENKNKIIIENKKNENHRSMDFKNLNQDFESQENRIFMCGHQPLLTYEETKKLLFSVSTLGCTSLILVRAWENCPELFKNKFQTDSSLSPPASNSTESSPYFEVNLSISIITSNLKCLCDMIYISINNSKIITQEMFDLVKKSTQNISISLLEISECMNTIHSTNVLSSSSSSSPPPSLNNDLLQDSKFFKNSTCHLTLFYFKNIRKIVKSWNILLNCLVYFAGKLPSDLRSSVPSLVPLQALILVQALSRKQTARIPRKNISLNHPIIVLNDIINLSVTEYLQNKLCSHLSMKEINTKLNIRRVIKLNEKYPERSINSCSNNDNNDDCDDDYSNNNNKYHKKRKFDSKTVGTQNVSEDNNDLIKAKDKENLTYTIDFVGSEMSSLVGNVNRGEYKDIIDKLGATYHPLDSSFHNIDTIPFSSSTPLLESVPSLSSSSFSPSLFHNIGIPVLQLLLIDEKKNTITDDSENVSSLAYLRPVKQNCTYALLVLPSSNPLSNDLDSANSYTNILKSDTKVVLKSTKSLAYVRVND